MQLENSVKANTCDHGTPAWTGCLQCRNEREAHLPMVVCPTCHGDGNGRGIERGMGCTVCHGAGEVNTAHAKRVLDARKRTVARYGY